MMLVASASAAGELRLSVPEHRVLLFDRGAKVELNASFRSARDRSDDVVFTLERKDFFGTTTAVATKTIRVAARATVDTTFDLDTQAWPRGLLTLTARATDSAGRLLDQSSLAIGVIDGPNTARAKPGEFCYAVCSHASSRHTRPDHPYWRWLAALGVDYARFDFSWNHVQPKPGAFRFDDFDKLVDQHLAIGVTPAPLLSYFARWFAPDGRTPPADLEPFYAYVESTVRRYHDRLKTWEVWNEADWGFWPGPFERYLELYRESYRRIKAIDPSARVMNSGWAFLNARQSYEKAGRFHEAVGSQIDIIAFHAHGDLAELKRKQAMLAEIVTRCGLQKIEIWDNESGWSSHANRTDREQAAILVKKIVHARSAGWGAYFWYDLIDDGTNRNNNEHNFGLVRANLAEPKPAFLAYHALIRALRGRSFARLIELPGKISCYAFEDGDETTWVLWLDEPAQKLAHLDIGAAAAPELIDLMGNARPADFAAGRLTAPVSATPSYLRWRRAPGSTAPRPVDDPVAFGTPLWLTVGAQNKIAVRVANPFDRPLSATVAVTAGDGAQARIAPAAVPVSLAAGATAELSFAVELAAPWSLGASLAATLTEKNRDVGRHQVRIQIAHSVPRHAGLAIDGDLREWSELREAGVLESADAVNNLFEFDPTHKEMHWHGPDDLSARAWLACDDGRVCLAVRVRDDVHRTDGASLLRGDALQAFASVDAARALEFHVALVDGATKIVFGAKNPEVGPGGDQFAAVVRRDEATHTTTYEVAFARSLLAGGAPALNFMVHDNDGAGSKGWVRWGDGLGTPVTPRLWPRLRLR